MADGDVLEDHIVLKETQAMRLIFDSAELESFYCVTMQSYKKMSKNVSRYLCELDFPLYLI